MEDRLKSMSIEITKRCNFRCNFCFANSNKTPVKEDYISDDKIDRIIHEIKENKLVKVTITGGEPLFEHELFLRMIKKLHENDITINLNTNISLMTDQIAQEIKAYIGAEFYIFTSLLSADERTCDYITGIPGSYKRVIEGIKCCKRNGLKVSVNFTISRDNVKDLILIDDFVKQYKVERVSISRVIPPSYERNSERDILTGEEIKQIADTLVLLNEKYGISVASSHPLPLCVIGDDVKYDVIECQMCRAGLRHCAVNLLTGNVFACSQENKNYGNIYEQSLYDCWINMKDGHGIDNLANKCQTCNLLSRCGGECKWSACTVC